MNTRYQRILVPVDGSPTSNLGLDEAIRLTKITGASLQLGHSVDELTYATGLDPSALYSADMIPLLLGGDAEQILRTATAPVLLVRGEPEAAPAA